MTASVRRRSERGMTLVEALVAVALMGIVTSAVAGAFIVTMGPDQQAANRLASAHDTQLAALWLPDDLQSATEVQVSGSQAPPCGDGAPINYELQLTWIQTLPSPLTFHASYRIRQVDDERQLVRYACWGTVNAGEIVVAHGLDEDLPGDRAVQVIPLGRQVTMRLRFSDGVVTTVTGTSRTPSPTCTIDFHALSQSRVVLRDGSLDEVVEMTISAASPPCTGLQLIGGPTTVDFDINGVAELPTTGWSTSASPYRLQVIDDSSGSEPLAEEELWVVGPPCEVQLDPRPNPVAMSDDGVNLSQDVIVYLDPNEYCTEVLEFAYTPTAGVSEEVQELPPSVTSVTVNGSTRDWAEGEVPLIVRMANDHDDVVGSVTLDVAGAPLECRVTDVTDASGRWQSSNNHRLRNPGASISVLTEGDCSSGLQLRFDPGESPAQNVPFTPVDDLSSDVNAPFTLSLGFHPSGFYWTSGAHTFTVFENDVAFTQTGNLEVAR